MKVVDLGRVCCTSARGAYMLVLTTNCRQSCTTAGSRSSFTLATRARTRSRLSSSASLPCYRGFELTVLVQAHQSARIDSHLHHCILSRQPLQGMCSIFVCHCLSFSHDYFVWCVRFCGLPICDSAGCSHGVTYDETSPLRAVSRRASLVHGGVRTVTTLNRGQI